MKTLKTLLVGAVALMALLSCSNEKEEAAASSPTTDGGTWSLTTDSGLFTAGEDGGSILFPASGGQVNFDVECPDSWTVQEEGADWLYLGVSPNAGMLSVTAQQSTLALEQTATLRLVTTEENVLFATISVVQSAYDSPELTLDSYEWNAPAVGALTTVIPVHSTDSWSVAVDADCDWLTAEATDEGLALTAEANEEYEVRTAEVTVTCTDGVTSDMRTVTVTQDGLVYLEVSPEELFCDYIGGTLTVTVESNYDWTYSTDVTWLTLSGEGNTLAVAVTRNEEAEDRSAVITIVAGDEAENVTDVEVTVNQTGFDDTAFILEFTISTDDKTVYYPICGTVNCTIDWGDGVVEEHTDSLPSHTYATAGVYNASVVGLATRLSTQTITSSGYYAENVEHITDVIQWGNVGFLNMYDGLMNTKIKSLPADTKKAFANVGSMYYAFSYCTELKEIDADLLSECTNTHQVDNMFSYDTSLETIPGKMFTKEKIPNNKSLKNMFQGCTALKEIPADIFEGCENVTNIGYFFSGCSSVTSIPEGLLDVLAESCTNIQYLFQGCSMKSVPDSLISKLTGLTTVQGLFADCEYLETIPEGFFDHCEKVTTSSNLFYKCHSLTSIPVNLYDKMTKIMQVGAMHYDCTLLTGESPYTELEIDGVKVKVHLYERSDYTDYFTKPNPTANCFYNCTGLSDYSSIPSGWK